MAVAFRGARSLALSDAIQEEVVCDGLHRWANTALPDDPHTAVRTWPAMYGSGRRVDGESAALPEVVHSSMIQCALPARTEVGNCPKHPPLILASAVPNRLSNRLLRMWPND